MSTDDAPGDPGWDDLDAETKHQILALANTINGDPSNVTRRDLLAGAGAVGAGTLLGGGATQALTEPAAASHGGATIGTSSDPIQMIHTEGVSSLDSLEAEEVNDTYYADPSDDINSVISSMSSGDELVITGDHTISSSIQPIDGITITVQGTVTLASGANTRIIDGGNSTSNVTIRGQGTLDGNKANQSYTGTRSDHPGVWVIGGTGNKVKDVTVQNVLAGAGVNVGGGGRNKLVAGVTVKDCGTSTEPCDGIFVWGHESRVIGNKVENITDAFIANDQCQDVAVVGNVCRNTSSYNTNVDSPQGGISCYANNGDWSGVIKGNVVRNTDTGYGISDVADNTYAVDAVISNNVIVNADDAIQVKNAGGETVVDSNRIVSPASRGVFLSAEAEVTDNTITGAGRAIYATAAGASIIGNKVVNPSIQGILIEADDVVVDENRVTGSSNHGVVANTAQIGVKVRDNTVQDCSKDGIRSAGGGTETDWVVSGNETVNNGNRGIILQGDWHLVHGNRSRGNTNADIDAATTNGLTTDNLTGT